MKMRKDKERLQRLAVVAAAAVEAEELLRMVDAGMPAEVRSEADRRIKLFHTVWDEAKR